MYVYIYRLKINITLRGGVTEKKGYTEKERDKYNSKLRKRIKFRDKLHEYFSRIYPFIL